MNRSQANSVFSSKVISLPTASARVVVFEPRPAWREAVMKRLGELVRLEPGWDGYRGEPVSLENATFALRMLEAVCGPDSPIPQIVPGASGDLQIEWHALNADIELHVQAPNSVHAWRQLVGVSGEGDDLDLTNEFSTVAAWVREMTEPDLAVTTAAA
jgi:hypothetical protein